MKIAVIGSGISGLMAAQQLHESQHAVTVFEAQDHIGGHAKTLRVPVGTGGTATVPAELGVFMHDPQYIHPTMNAYARELGVKSQRLELGFSYSSAGHQLAWSISSKHSGILRDIGCVVAVLWDGVRQGRGVRNWTFMRDLHRFLQSLPELRSSPVYTGMRLENFLEQENYSDCFVQTWLLPQMHCWWGVTQAHALDADIQVIADSMHDVARAPQYFFADGWDTFLKGIYAPFEDRVQTNRRVQKVERRGDQVRVTVDGCTEDFDHVIFALPPTVALELLAAASAEEAAILQRFETIRTTVFVHSDRSWLPAKTRWSTINLMHDERGAFSTFWNGALHPGKPPVFTTWGDGLAAVPDAAKTLTVDHWLRTLPTVNSVKASREIAAIQGNGGVWYCGAHVHALDAHRVPSLWHENALQSGVRTAQDILSRQSVVA